MACRSVDGDSRVGVAITELLGGTADTQKRLEHGFGAGVAAPAHSLRCPFAVCLRFACLLTPRASACLFHRLRFRALPHRRAALPRSSGNHPALAGSLFPFFAIFSARTRRADDPALTLLAAAGFVRPARCGYSAFIPQTARNAGRTTAPRCGYNTLNARSSLPACISRNSVVRATCAGCLHACLYLPLPLLLSTAYLPLIYYSCAGVDSVRLCAC